MKGLGLRVILLSHVAIFFCLLNVFQAINEINLAEKVLEYFWLPHDRERLRVGQALRVRLVFLSKSLQSSPGDGNKKFNRP